MQDNASAKAKLINLINSVRTLMRSTWRRQVLLSRRVLTILQYPSYSSTF